MSVLVCHLDARPLMEGVQWVQEIQQARCVPVCV